MKTLQPDLFPETMIVSREGDRIYTTSLHVAEFSKKRHKDVLKAIENKLKVLPERFIGRNFALSEYLDPRGRNDRGRFCPDDDGFHRQGGGSVAGRVH